MRNIGQAFLVHARSCKQYQIITYNILAHVEATILLFTSSETLLVIVLTFLAFSVLAVYRMVIKVCRKYDFQKT